MKPSLSLHRLPLYNTGRLDDEEIIAAFAARGALFDRIIADLAAEGPDSRAQHHLLVGQRGMGKTMLLSRIAAEIRTGLLSQRYVPLVFAEEQYAVDRLSKFWLNCLDSLADARERTGVSADAERIDKIVSSFSSRISIAAKDDMPLANDVLDAFLKASAEIGRRPVLLVDNLQLVFERITEGQQHALRELLMRPGSPVLIGASPSPPPESQDYGAAFFDHFKVHYLRPLEVKEMQALMLHLADAIGREDVRSRIVSHPHRLQVLRQLTGGNPRTTATLFFLYAEDFAPTVFGDLENLLDRVTPLYKARFEELSTQQQVIASAIANNWDPVTSRTLSEVTGLPMTGISGQLDRLEKTGFIERVSLFGQSSSGYQIAERFFNVWFLMRSASRRQRREVEFLARFLENFYESDDRSRIARQLLCEYDLSPDRHIFTKALAATLDDKAMAEDLERHAHLDALRQKAADSRRKLDEILDLSSLPPATLSFNELRNKLMSSVPENAPVAPEEFARAILGDRLMFMSRDRERLASRKEPLGNEEIERLTNVTRDHQTLDEEKYGKGPIGFLVQRLSNGQIRALNDLADWNRTILLCPDNQTMNVLLNTIPDGFGNRLSAEAKHKAGDALEAWKHGTADEKLSWIRIILLKFSNPEGAVEALEEMFPIFHSQLESCEKSRLLAERVRKEAVTNSDSETRNKLLNSSGLLVKSTGGLERSATHAMVQLHVLIGAIHLYRLSDPKNAEKSYRQALVLDPDCGGAWVSLGDLYSNWLEDRTEDAAEAYAKALDLDPSLTGVAMLYFYRDVLMDFKNSVIMLDRLKENPDLNSTRIIKQQEGLFSAYNQNWGIASCAFSRALDWELDDFEITDQEEWVHTSAVLVHLGYCGEFLALLEQRGDHVRFRPWYEALKAHQVGDRDYLLNIAPEIRTSAEALYDAIKERLDKLPESTRRRPLPKVAKKRGKRR